MVPAFVALGVFLSTRKHEAMNAQELPDHRKLGRALDLFSIQEEVGGGLVLWHPKGALVRKLMEDWWRDAHLARGYSFVASPHLGRAELWERSGHLDFYRDSMFPRMQLEDDESSPSR